MLLGRSSLSTIQIYTHIARARLKLLHESHPPRGIWQTSFGLFVTFITLYMSQCGIFNDSVEITGNNYSDVYMDRRRSSYIVPEIYEATTNPDHWDYVTTMIAKLTRSKSACLYHKNKMLGSVNRIANFKMPENSGLAFGCGDDSLVEMLAKKSSNLMDEESACVQIHPCSKGMLSYDSDIYTRWAEPNNIFYVAGAKVFESETHEGGIAILRDKASGNWEKGELRVIDEIIPHLERALNIYSEFSHLALRMDSLLNGLDRLMVGIILYDKNALPLYINPTARSIIDKHPGLKLQDDEIVVTERGEAKKLHQAIIDTAAINPDDSWLQSISLGITHPKIATPLPLLVTTIQTDPIASEIDYEGAKVAVFMSDPDLEQPISADNLISVYSLTKSESQVAIGLVNGHSIEEIANGSNHSIHTIRSQLKSVFRKTGVSRQGELIKLLLTGPFAQRRRSTQTV